MKPADFVQEFFYPITHLAPFVTITTFALLNLLAVKAGFFGIWLAIVVLPATIRYQMLILEARSKGVDPDPPGIENFTFVGNAWSIFPIVHYAIAIALLWGAADIAGESGVIVMGVALAILLPAALAVLAITRNPIESLNPASILGLIGRVWTSYWAIPVALFLIAFLQSTFFGVGTWPAILANIFLSFSIYSVIGGMIQPFHLHDEVDIEAPVEREEKAVVADLEKARTGVLNHAYGFASRGNVDGGLSHIRKWLRTDEPYPGDAWPWFFDSMLKWDDSYPALKLAQEYLDVLLAAGEKRAALKLMLRCKHLNDAFRPNPDSRERALAAAREAGHPELEEWLSRR